MNNNGKLALFIMITALLCLAWSADIRAKDDASAYVETGALAYGNWTSTEAGGSGIPSGETYKDYIRCKSCHGWDRLGMKGGYVRRIRTAERTNASTVEIIPNENFSDEFKALTIYISRLTPPENCGDE